jgi:hypothetical protein
MDFVDVSSYFDDDPVYDAYSGQLLFYCQTTSHNDQTSSGATARRRTMTTVDSTVAPPGGVVRVYNDYWLVSDSNPDGFRGEHVRRSYSLKKSTGLVTLLTPAQAALGSAGINFHAQREYFRDTQDARSSAEWDVMFNVFCPLSEPVAKGSFLRQGAELMRVRNAYPTIDGYRIAEADQLDADAFQPARFSKTALDIITDQRTAINISTTVVQTDVSKFYAFRVQGEATNQPGDRCVFVARAALTPAIGTELVMLDMAWTVLAVVPEGDSWALHCRPA